MNTKELIETLKLQATFVNAGGYINQGNVMKKAAERLEELELWNQDLIEQMVYYVSSLKKQEDKP